MAADAADIRVGRGLGGAHAAVPAAGSGDVPDRRATRSYTSFSQALTELTNARVWGGVHFRTASVQGVLVGRSVSGYGVSHYLLPRR